MLKVYFVDDAGWLISELKQIIDWEHYGYAVCGYNTDPLVAKTEILAYMPDLVISDIHMDELDGLSLCEQVQSQAPQINFCFLSAYDRFDYAVSAIKLGAVDYLTKPIKKDMLLSVLERVSLTKMSVRYEQLLEHALAGGGEEPLWLSECGLSFFAPEINGVMPRVAVFYGKGEELNPKVLSEVGQKVNTIYNDNIQIISFVYGANIDKLKELVLRQVSIGLSPVITNTKELVRSLKISKLNSRGDFLDGKCRLIVHQDSSVTALEKAAIEALDNVNELDAYLGNLLARAVNQEMELYALNSIYRAVIVKAVQLGQGAAEGLFSGMSVTEIYGCLEEMVSDLRSKVSAGSIRESNSAVAKIVMDIEQSVANRHTLSQYAEKYGYNLSYLSVLFKKTTGKSFVDYVVGNKIEAAKRLILSTDKTMSEISTELGYDDYFHFSKQFKKFTGMSPTDYKSRFSAAEEK